MGNAIRGASRRSPPGQNVTFEYRYAENRLERLPELAAELVRLMLRPYPSPLPLPLPTHRADNRDFFEKLRFCPLQYGEGMQPAGTLRRRYKLAD